MLVLERLAKRYGAMAAVQGATLSVPAGQFVGVIGRSGAGKSTLLRMINRLSQPSGGNLSWRDEDVTTIGGRDLRLWRRRCAMIFQHFNLVGRLDVLENVMLGRLGHMPAWRVLAKAWTAEDRAIAFAALDQLDIASLAGRRADNLSGGQQQRVAIARALVQEPDIILADEPVAALDPRNTKIVMEALRRINRHFGVTMMVNLHSLDLARGYCDRLIGMAAGKIVFDGAPAALTDDVARELYGMEADDVLDAIENDASEPQGALVPAT